MRILSLLYKDKKNYICPSLIKRPFPQNESENRNIRNEWIKLKIKMQYE